MKQLLLFPALLSIIVLYASPASSEDATRMAEDHIAAGIRLFEEGQSDTYVNQSKLDEAVMEFNEALRYDPNSAKARYHLAITCLAMDAISCSEKQYQLLKGLDERMAEVLKAKISEYKIPKRFIHVGTKGDVWTPPEPEEEKAPPASAAPAEAPGKPADTEVSASPSGCEIVSFSTSEKAGGIRTFADGRTMYGGPQQCVTATIKNTGTSKAFAKDFMIVARFSDGDTMKERIGDGLSDMDAVEPGNTVTGSACFEKEKATITVVECGKW